MYKLHALVNLLQNCSSIFSAPKNAKIWAKRLVKQTFNPLQSFISQVKWRQFYENAERVLGRLGFVFCTLIYVPVLIEGTVDTGAAT